MSQLKKQHGNLYIRDSTGKWRLIGNIDEELNTLQIFRNKKNHLHRNTNSYGLNKEAVDSGMFAYIMLIEKTENRQNSYIIPVEDARILPAYKAKDFEIQLLISLDKLKDYKF